MYSIVAYGEMIADEPRVSAYRAALARVVRPETDVLDLGCGPGWMSLLASKLGARRVLAVEPDASIVLARQLAVANGLESKIHFVNSLSTRVEPPYRCHVAVSDLRGVLPLFMQHLPSLIDMRRRWLLPGGVQIPQVDRVQAALVGSREVFRDHFPGWLESPEGLDFRPALQLRSCMTRKVRLDPDDLLTEPVCWGRFDYRKVESPDHQASVAWTVDRAGTGYGLALWFESELVEGITMSNRPGLPPMIYGQMFYPWPAPVELQAGDRVAVQITAKLLEDDYLWIWNTEHQPLQGAGRRFQQSTFQGSLWTREQLDRVSVSARPALSARGQAVRRALSAMDGAQTLEEIARSIHAEFPGEFSSRAAALRLVTSLQADYGGPAT